MKSKEIALLKVVNSLVATSPKKAGKLLEDYASENGDIALQAVLPEMEVIDVIKVIRQYDYTSPTILTWLMDPEHILEAVKKIPLFWEDNSAESVQLEIIDFLYYILENQEENRTSEIMEVLLLDDFSRTFIQTIFVSSFLDGHYNIMVTKIKKRILSVEKNFFDENIDSNNAKNILGSKLAVLVDSAQSQVYKPEIDTSSMFTQI